MRTRFVAIFVGAIFPLGAVAQSAGVGAGVDAGATAAQGAGSPTGVQGGASAGARSSGSSDSASGSAQGRLAGQGSTLGRGGAESDTQAFGRGNGNVEKGSNQPRPRPRTPEELNAPGTPAVTPFGPSASGAAGDMSGTTRN